MQVGDRVQYVGVDLPNEPLWTGHPGRIIDVGLWPHDLVVFFVNGASMCLPSDDLRLIDETTYQRIGVRTANLLHPFRDEPIPRVFVAGQEWPDERLPTAGVGLDMMFQPAFKSNSCLWLPGWQLWETVELLDSRRQSIIDWRKYWQTNCYYNHGEWADVSLQADWIRTGYALLGELQLEHLSWRLWPAFDPAGVVTRSLAKDFRDRKALPDVDARARVEG